MALVVLWTPHAKRNYDEIKNYLLQEWNDNVVIGFENRVSDFMDVLSEFPNIGSLELKNNGIRGFQLTKQVRLFYRIKDNKVIILSLFDTRQDPEKRF